MALAAVFTGILTGIAFFVIALIFGHGLIAAAGFYVIGGFLGASAQVVRAVTRAQTEVKPQRRPVVVRS